MLAWLKTLWRRLVALASYESVPTGRAELPMRDLVKLAKNLAQPAIQLLSAELPSQSYFGGCPHLPESVAWPQRNGKKLGFLARISLNEVANTCAVNWLPARGALLFFYDATSQPWGFDPKDRDGWSVLWVPDISSQVAANQNELKPDQSSSKEYFYGVIRVSKRAVVNATETVPLNFMPLTMRKIALVPDVASTGVLALNLNDLEWDHYADLRTEAFGDALAHQLTGFASPIQGEMELACQLASHDVYCGDGRDEERAQGFAEGAKNWRLLLQIVDDEALGLMFGDCGTLYFWVEETRAKQGDFSNVWVILQCS
jgi:uncharacterized protein YwqG